MSAEPLKVNQNIINIKPTKPMAKSKGHHPMKAKMTSSSFVSPNIDLIKATKVMEDDQFYES